MHRIALVALLLVSNAAWAEWKQMSSSEAQMVVYVDPDTIRIDGEQRQIMELRDLKTPDKNHGGRSVRVLSEYDCKQGRIRVLREEYFSGQMGAGERIGGNAEPSDWVTLSPGTIGGNLQRFVCTR